MNQKQSFKLEMEVPGDPKVLFHYLSTTDGLSSWFCEDAEELGKNEFNLIWSGKDHHTRLISKKKNKTVKFEFLPDEGESTDGQNPFVEYSIIYSELDGTQFLRIEDYSKNMDTGALALLWAELSAALLEAMENEAGTDAI